MTDRDYVLGTHDAEIERLGLQHRVWRPKMLDAFARAGIAPGMAVLDAGAGPGYASLDLAEIVGPAGSVLALERSARFVESARERLATQPHATVLEADILDHRFAAPFADAAWVRWLLSFVEEPRRALDALLAAVRPGGTVVLHEYLQYGTWRVLPPDPALDGFAQRVIAGVAAAGGEMDVAAHIPGWLADAGCRVASVRPLIEIVPPTSVTWRWPASFVAVNSVRQHELGLATAAEAEATRAALARAEANPHAWMVTPLILEVIATKAP